MAMTKDDMAMVAMEIVAYSGDARTKFLDAMDAIGEKDFAKAEALIKEGDDLILNGAREVVADVDRGVDSHRR